MDRREFIKHTATSSLLAAYPTVVYSGAEITVKPSGSDDTSSINNALRASARTGDPVRLLKGNFSVTDSIVIVSGSRLIGSGKTTAVTFNGGKDGIVIRIDEPVMRNSVVNLYVEDKRSPVPFVSLIG
jgi:hypothetical protein